MGVRGACKEHLRQPDHTPGVPKVGEGCPERIVGDFAFCIVDRRRHMVFCARDASGDRPFYYYLSDKIFVFGSEIQALFALPEDP